MAVIGPVYGHRFFHRDATIQVDYGSSLLNCNCVCQLCRDLSVARNGCESKVYVVPCIRNLKIMKFNDYKIVYQMKSISCELFLTCFY